MKGKKTVVFAAASFVVYLLGWDQITAWVDAKYIALVGSVATFVLRLVTDTPVFKSKSE